MVPHTDSFVSHSFVWLLALSKVVSPVIAGLQGQLWQNHVEGLTCQSWPLCCGLIWIFHRAFFSFLLLWASIYCHGFEIFHLGGKNLIRALLLIWLDASFPRMIYMLSLFPGGKEEKKEKRKKKERRPKKENPKCLGTRVGQIFCRKEPIIPSCLS